MYAELERLKKLIAYDAEEAELKNQLAWAKVFVSEKESANLLEEIAKKNEVMMLSTEHATSIPRIWKDPKRK